MGMLEFFAGGSAAGGSRIDKNHKVFIRDKPPGYQSTRNPGPSRPQTRHGYEGEQGGSRATQNNPQYADQPPRRRRDENTHIQEVVSDGHGSRRAPPVGQGVSIQPGSRASYASRVVGMDSKGPMRESDRRAEGLRPPQSPGCAARWSRGGRYEDLLVIRPSRGGETKYPEQSRR